MLWHNSLSFDKHRVNINIISDIYFAPSLDVMEEDGLFYTLMEMMKDMFLQTTLFPRIDPIVPIASYEGTSLHTFFN